MHCFKWKAFSEFDSNIIKDISKSKKMSNRRGSIGASAKGSRTEFESLFDTVQG